MSDTAIEALRYSEFPNSSDCISRQAAIDAMNGLPKWSDDLFSAVCLDYSDVISVLSDTEKLPSAQPEIIRCEDCKWYGRSDKRRFYRGMDCLQKRIDTIIPDKDFCSRAERREE